MTNFSDLAHAFSQIQISAPEAFMPIENEADLIAATAFLKKMDQEMGETPGHTLAPLADALMHRIMAFEAKHFPIPDADGPMMLAFYLEQRQLTQQQLAAATGISQPILSQLLNRRRSFTADHARALAKQFGVGPEMFL